MLSQQDVWGFVKVVELRGCVIGIRNRKKLWIDLERAICEGKMMASELGYNTCEKWPGWSSFYATSLVFLQVYV